MGVRGGEEEEAPSSSGGALVLKGPCVGGLRFVSSRNVMTQRYMPAPYASSPGRPSTTRTAFGVWSVVTKAPTMAIAMPTTNSGTATRRPIRRFCSDFAPFDFLREMATNLETTIATGNANNMPHTAWSPSSDMKASCANAQRAKIRGPSKPILLVPARIGIFSLTTVSFIDADG